MLMAEGQHQIVFLDTSYLDALFNRERGDVHTCALQYFEYWIKSEVLLLTSAICIAEYCAHAERLHGFFKRINILSFTPEDAILAGRLYKKYKGPILGHHVPRPPGVKDALKDDFKIVASAARSGAKVIAHNDIKTMKWFVDMASSEFLECKNLESVILQDGFDVKLHQYVQTTFDMEMLRVTGNTEEEAR